MVGDDTTVTVVGIKGNQVRLGFNAPKTIPIDREEVRERSQREPRSERKRSYDPIGARAPK